MPLDQSAWKRAPIVTAAAPIRFRLLLGIRQAIQGPGAAQRQQDICGIATLDDQPLTTPNGRNLPESQSRFGHAVWQPTLMR